MIKYNNAIRTARLLLGTPYSEMDCIRLIVMVIRRSSGGDPDYRCEGTNWLWRSIDNSAKYRHLTWRQNSISGAKAGMVAFKVDGDNVHHIGLVTEKGTVIHSSSVQGCVVETPLDKTWHALGQHKLITVSDVESDHNIENDTESVVNDTAIEDEETVGSLNAYTSLIRSDGMTILLAGSWRVADD